MMNFSGSGISRRFYRDVLSVAVSLLLIVPSAFALEEKTAPLKTMPEPPVGAGQLANITLGLIVVLGLIFALAWLYRRYGNISSFNRSNIHVVGGVSLGTREKAILLEVEGERILVGVTPSQVTRLLVLNSQAHSHTSSQTSEEAVVQADNIEDFASKLQQEQNRSSEVKA